MSSAPILFKPLAQAPGKLWRKPASYGFAKDVSQIPIADSELLLTSYSLPIAVDCLAERPRVVAILDGRFQRAAALGENGQWLKGYLPLALRCLPFRLAGPSADTLEVAINLPVRDEPGLPLFAPDNTLTPEVRQTAALLRRLEDGRRELQRAAEQLLIAGLLTPIQLHRTAASAGTGARSFTVSREKFAALSGDRLAIIAKDSFLAIDLAVACIFSQRLMPALVSTTESTGTARTGAQSALASVDDMISPLHLNVQVDDSELFSFEQFRNAVGK